MKDMLTKGRVSLTPKVGGPMQYRYPGNVSVYEALQYWTCGLWRCWSVRG